MPQCLRGDSPSAVCILAAAGALALASAAPAQVPPPPVTAPATVLERVGIDQQMGAALPADLVFRNETGEEVAMGGYFGRRPVVLALVYYRCPMLCNLILNGMLATFKTLSFEVGKEFEVVVVSFDPHETPELAAAKKETYLAGYGRPGSAAGWHFLTGNEDSIRRLCAACGFRYDYDAATGQYAHGSAIMVLTPEGRLSRYFYGIEYPPRDLRLSLVEASAGRIGSVVERVLLLCYQYDPASGRYGLVIMGSLRIAGLLTLLALGLFVGFSVRRDRRARASAPSPPDAEAG